MGNRCLSFRFFRFFNCFISMIKFREQEKVYLVKRRHRFVLVKNLIWIAFAFLAVIVLMGIMFFTSFSFPDFFAETFPSLLDYKARIFALYFLSLALLILWQIIFITVANYYLDCWIVTNKRTVHTELRSLFSRILSSVPHHRVQDITVEVKGIIPTLFRYGNLQIQTAGKFHEFIFKEIPDPYETKEVIFKAQKKYFKKMRERGVSVEEMAQEEIVDVAE